MSVLGFCFLFSTMCALKRVQISCCGNYRGIDSWYIYELLQLADLRTLFEAHIVSIKRTRLKCCH